MSEPPATGPLICLMGPTASGKTAAAMALFDALPVALISVDSAQVYRGMDIGTGKPEPALLARYPHALIDIIDPEHAYSAAMFARDAGEAVRQAWSHGRVPLLVGGTGLYFRALLEGLHPLPPANAALRRGFEADARAHGWPAVHARLAALDPPTAARLHVNDAQRIARALEVCMQSGARYSDLIGSATTPALTARPLKLIVTPSDRAQLHRRIAVRFHAMLADGLVDEVERLRAHPRLTASLPSMRSVGYRQVWAHLDGEIAASELADRGIFATRQLARRQLTWLRRESDSHWMDSSAQSLVSELTALVDAYVAKGAGACN